MSRTNFWIRRHGNGWRAYVRTALNDTYAAAAKATGPMSGVAYQEGIPSLVLAQQIADAKVQDKAPHVCDQPKCETWPSKPSQTPED